jgi:hypothetical protein
VLQGASVQQVLFADGRAVGARIAAADGWERDVSARFVVDASGRRCLLAVALAAGHRPCALCRREDFNAGLDAWHSAFGERPRVDPMDRRLHAERVQGKWQRRHRMAWADVPAGTFAVIDEVPALALEDRLVPWSPAGYGPPIDRPSRGNANVLTPPSTVMVLRHGYRPEIHPTVSADGL